MKKNNPEMIDGLCRFFLMAAVVSLVVVTGCTAETPTATDTAVVDETSLPDPTAVVTEAPEATPTQSPPAYLVVQPEDLQGIAVRFVHPWAGKGAQALEEIATQFSLTNPWDIWVDVEAKGSESVLLAELQSDIAAGKVPGLIAIHPYTLSILEGEYLSVSLTDYYNDPEWGFDAEAQADIPQVFLDRFIREDTLIALPVAPQATVLFYNQTWAEEMGFSSPPANAVEFSEQSCEATFANLADRNEENDGTGGYPRNTDPNVLAGWFSAFGGQLPLNQALAFNSVAGQEAFGYLKAMDVEGCIWVNRQPDPYYYFANRYALLYAGTLEQIPAQMGWLEVAQNQDVWIAIGFPGPEGESIVVDGPGMMVTADSPEKQMAAWLFARHLLEPDIQDKLVRSLLTLPVRESAIDSLQDFAADYPQWAQGAAMVEIAEPLPSDENWGFAQWMLQDAITRLFQSEDIKAEEILIELDDMIDEMGTAP